MEHIMNKTLDEIKNAYDEWVRKEDDLREMIRMRLSSILMNTNQDNKFRCDIALDTRECIGLSSLNLPWVTSMWQHPTEGYITFDIDDGRSVTDFDGLSTEELITIIEAIG